MAVNRAYSAESENSRDFMKTEHKDMKHFDSLGVCVQSACFSYGGTSNGLILDNTNISVPLGVTYALLGPSGCGKTTLLKCLTGLITLQSGVVKVLGDTPGTKESSVPGHGLGYMPQEEALYGQFTIKEIMLLFGRLQGATGSVIIERLQRLSALLNLPPENKHISSLSGGQRRRVSLACALIGCPPLLILDEPTVGVDPLLRSKIWTYLNLLAVNKGTTIIITTHYIEEAKDADIIGMMRNGQMLAETTPSQLKEYFNTTKLEYCFAQLCLKSVESNKAQDEENFNSVFFSIFSCLRMCKTSLKENQVTPTIEESRSSDMGDKPIATSLQYTTKELSDNRTKKSSKFIGSLSTEDVLISSDRELSELRLNRTTDNIKVLLLRNYWVIKKNFLIVFFQFGLPVIQSILFSFCVGRDLFSLPLAIVNEEDPPTMSKIYLQHVDEVTLIPHRVDDLQTAINTVVSGTNTGVLHIGHNYTRCLLKRLQLGMNVDNATIDCSSMRAHLDFSNYLISSAVFQSLLKSHHDFQEEVLETIGASKLIAKPGLDVSEPVYGSVDTSYTEYILPNVIVYFAFFLAVALTAVTFILEKKSGIFDRLKMSGVTLNQMLVSHILIELVIIVIQAFLLITIPNLAFGFTSKGPFMIIALIILLQGLLGISFGVFISAVASEEVSALNFLIAVIYPGSIMSGFLWPIQAIPMWLRYICYLVPFTFPCEAVRSIITRGWGFESLTVWLGIITSTAWIFITLALTVIALKIKK